MPAEGTVAEFCCPSCQKLYKIRNAQPGRAYQCKECQVALETLEPIHPARVRPQTLQPTLMQPTAVKPGPQIPGSSPTDDELKIKDLDEAREPDLTRIVPECFDGYRVARVLGRGGMGVVLEAEHESLRRKTALKVMLPGAELGEPHAVERFLREARSVARLKHPHIVEIYDVGRVNGMPYLSMEYVEGRPLGDFFFERKLGHRQVAEILARVARALAVAHRQGIVHRDIKPDNIMLRFTGEPVLMDFGLAKDTEARSMQLSVDGNIMGTPAYMSPEQAQAEPADARSDVYSLGAVLYEALAGRPPFKANTVVATIYQVVHERPQPLREVDPRIAPALETICIKAMEKDPARRYATAEEMAEDLERFLEGRAVSAQAPGLGVRMSEAVRKRKALFAGVLSAAAVLVLLGVAMRFGFLQSGPTAAEQLREALARGSVESRRSHVHALAGDLLDGRIEHASERADALKALRKAAANEDVPTAVAALEALAKLKDQDAQEAIGAETDAKRPVEVRKAALKAYAAIGYPDRGELLLNLLKQEDDLGIRLAALEALGDLPDPQIQLYLIKLATRGEPPALAAAARHKLGKLRSPKTLLTIYAGGRGTAAGAHLAETLEATSGYEAQLEAALEGTLPGDEAKRKGPEVFEIAAKKLQAGSAEERLQAAFDLGVLADPRAENPLVNALLDLDADVALAAGESLGKLPKLAHPGQLAQYLKGRPPHTRRAAARALGRVHPRPSAAPAIEALATERDAGVQAELAQALGRLKDSQAVPPLLTILADGAPIARRMAAWALGQLGDRSAARGLVEALERAGDDAELKEEIAGALSALTGKSLGTDAGKWRKADTE